MELTKRICFLRDWREAWGGGRDVYYNNKSCRKEYAKCFITGCSYDLSHRCMREDVCRPHPIWIDDLDRRQIFLKNIATLLQRTHSHTLTRDTGNRMNIRVLDETFCMRFPKFHYYKTYLFSRFSLPQKTHTNGFAERSKILAVSKKF